MTKIPPKNFSIESIVGLNERRSPEIDIENTISDFNHDHSEDEDLKVRDGKVYYFNQSRVPNFPFFMSYDKRGMGGSYPENQGEDLKRSSPSSVRSEVDSDGPEERPHGKCFLK